jgi:hypothetical protein
LAAIVTTLDWRVEGPAIAVLGFAPLMLALDRRYFPRLIVGPVLFMYLYYALGYSIGPLWQMYIVGYLFNIIEEGFVLMQWGAVWGLIAFALTFPVVFKWARRLFALSPAKNSSTVVEDERWTGYTLILTGLVIFALIYGFVTGAGNRLGGLEQALEDSALYSLLHPLHYAAFFFLGYQAARRGLFWRVLWMLMLVGYSLFFFLDGRRGAAALAATFSGIGWYWGGTSARRVLLAGAIGLAMIIPISVIVLNYRNQTYNVGTSLEARISGLVDTMQGFLSQEASSAADATAAFARGITAAFGDRVFVLTPATIPFAGLDGLENVIYIFTPLLINPNRPNLNDGNALAIEYQASLAPKGNYLPSVAEGYRRAGWVGIALHHIFMAVVFALFLAFVWARRHQREWVATLMFLIFESSQIMGLTVLGTFYFALWQMPRTMFTFWVVRVAQDLVETILFSKRYQVPTRHSLQRVAPGFPRD